MTTRFPLSTMTTTATFAAILLGVHYSVTRVPGLDPASLHPVADFRFDHESFVPLRTLPLPDVPANLAIPNPEAIGFSAAAAANLSLESQFLVDTAGSMDHFYASLDELTSGRRTRPVRVIHYGDSPTTADLITGDARELLQERFGDGGPGFLLIAKPWAWYGHHGVEIGGSGWKIETAVGSMREAAYGLGGVIFTGQPGAVSTIKLEGRTRVSSVEVQYLAQPGAGSVEVLADGQSVATVATAVDTRRNGAETVALPAGTREIELRVAGGTVQLFGVALGAGNKGLTYDSIGLNGASTTVMSRAFEPREWGDALEHRAPDLVVINYGTNESSFPAYVDKLYEPELRRAVARVRAALPEASVLVMSPMDRGTRADGETIVTMPAIPAIVAIQQRVATELGCGFFNTYQAMGGQDTMARWYDGHPRLVSADFIHPTPQGARIVAQVLTGQLLIGYERYEQGLSRKRAAELRASASSPAQKKTADRMPIQGVP